MFREGETYLLSERKTSYRDYHQLLIYFTVLYCILVSPLPLAMFQHWHIKVAEGESSSLG
jgi:hypothetical protein